jgi:hypothetical protein
MFSIQFMGCSLAAMAGAGALFASVATTEAAMLPRTNFTTNYIQRADCAVGAHIGPLGTCILGAPDPDQRPVIERRAVEAPPREGCTTKTVRKENGMGDSVTKSRTDCD